MSSTETTRKDLVIGYTPADGVTLDGSTRGDGVYDVLRTLGLNWRSMRDGSGMLYVRESRDKDIARLRHVIDRTRDALEQAAAGRWTVAVELADGDGFRPAGERRADADDRAADRADMLADRAGRRFSAAAAQDDLNRQRAGRMTDEPIKIGHHSEGRHRRAVEQLRAGSTKAGELRAAGAYAAERARGVEANAEHRKNPRAIMRRIELLEAQRRGYARELAGYARESRNGAGVVVYRDEFPGATGQRADDLRRWDARDAEEIEHLRALLADMETAGTFAAWGPEHFQTGDLVRVLGSWLPVRRVNRKSVSVPGGYGMAGNDATWNATATWDKVEGRRRDGLQLDTPNGEPWPVELARRVARWAQIHAYIRHAHQHHFDSPERRQARNAEWAQRITHGLPLGASDAEVKAIRDSITGTDDVRALASAYLAVFDRIEAGERIPEIAASLTPITGNPAWTLPTDVEPVDRHPQDLRPGDLVAGVWDTAGLRGGRATTLHRGFCGPVESVSDVRDYGELGRWVIVTLTTGDARDFSVTRWIAVHPADGGDPAETVEPAPDGDPEPADAPAETDADAPADTDGDDDTDPWGDVLDGDDSAPAEPVPARAQWEIRNDAIGALDDFPGLGAEWDAEWSDVPGQTFGEALARGQALARAILERHGHLTRADGDGFQPGDAVTVAGWSAGTCEVAGTDDAGRVLVDLGGEISHVPADRVEPAAPSFTWADLRRRFKVLHVPSGKAFWILGGDTRYTVTGPGVGQYRADPDGTGVLLRSAVDSHPWGWVAELADLAPLPDGEGVYATDDAAPRVDHVALTGYTLDDGAHTILAQLATDLTRAGDTDPDKIAAVWRLARRVVTTDPDDATSAADALHQLREPRTTYPRGARVDRATKRLAELLAPVLDDLEPGQTVRSRMHVAGRVVAADVVAEVVDRLGCGCQRVRATRPDGRTVELLGGCSFHPAELENPAGDPPAVKWRLIYSASTGGRAPGGRWDQMLTAMREVLGLEPDADLPAITAAQKADGRSTNDRAVAYLAAYARRLDPATAAPVDRIALPFITLAQVDTNTPDGIVRWCATRGHPWVTYNPWIDSTWCRCGNRTIDGSKPLDMRAIHETHHTCSYDDPAPCRCYLDADRASRDGAATNWRD